MSKLVLFILGLVALCLSVSSPTPSLVYYCNATSEKWGCSIWNPLDPTHCQDDPLPLMYWTKKVERSDMYRIYAGSETDPVNHYTPDTYLDIIVRSTVYGAAYRGILLYAENEKEEKVGSWNLDGEDSPPDFITPYTEGPCKNSLLHNGAREKPYFKVFKFKTPAAGTGKITFRCLIKYGWANTGAFYWPNLEGDIVLKEGSPYKGVNWVKGPVGKSCNEVCGKIGKACDEKSLSDTDELQSFDSIENSNVCRGPLMSTCSGSPSINSLGFCYVPESKSTCASENRTYSASNCDTKSATDMLFCPCSGADRNQLNFFSLALMALFYISGNGKKSRSSFNFTILIFVLVTLSFVQFSSAHNWVRSRSRYFGASTRVPCYVGTEKPHAQVGPGQSFQVEWMTGHGSSTYFVLVKAEDESYLDQVTDRILDEYIRNGPTNMGNTTQKYMKYHRRGANTTDVTVQVNLKDTVFYLKNEVKPADPNYVNRPLYFRTQSPTWLFSYFDADIDQDAYVSYSNSKYPWILAVWRYEHSIPHPGEFDVTNFEIPSSAPAGRYVLQYSWRGYYDCIDVQKMDTPVADIYGTYNPLNTTWERIDHCYFPKPRDVVSQCAQIVDNVNYCMKRCFDEFDRCTGVQVLPVHNPSSVYKDFQQETLIPWEKGQCYDNYDGQISQQGKAEEILSATPNTTYICYALLARNPTELISEYVVSEDPDDPVFYGTCYYKRPYLQMIGFPPDSNEAPKEFKWRFNHRCLDCDNYAEIKTKTNFNDVPIWKISDKCRDCDKEPGSIKAPQEPQIVRANASCDGLTYGSWSAGNKTIHNNCSDIKLECNKRLYPLNQNVYLTKDECFKLARKNSICSSTVTLRVYPTSSRTTDLWNIGLKSNFTECYCYINQPCCKQCSSRGNTGWEIYDLSEPTADPVCATGIIAADGFGCCSASCGAGNCTTTTGPLVPVGHCCASLACGVTRSCDKFGPPCRMSTQYVPPPTA